MRTLVTRVEWETVANESDALLREQELIKTEKFLGPYNEEIEDYDYSYNELYALEDGWAKAFGYELICELRDTLKETNGGKGMAAIQIGYPMQICICSWDGQELVMINPEITRTRGQQNFLEGCLSSPGIYVEVPRAQKVWCEYTDENGERKMIDKGGRMSNIIQHELDHFDGWCEVFNELVEGGENEETNI